MNAIKALEYLDEPSDDETNNEISESSEEDAFSFKNKKDTDYDVTLKLSSPSDENEASSTSDGNEKIDKEFVTPIWTSFSNDLEYLFCLSYVIQGHSKYQQLFRAGLFNLLHACLFFA